MNVHAIVYYYIEGNKVINIGCNFREIMEFNWGVCLSLLKFHALFWPML